MLPNMNLSDARKPEPLPANAYIMKVKRVKIDQKYNRLQLEIDIDEGPKAGHFAKLEERYSFWGLVWNLYMDDENKWKFLAAIEMFKACNDGFTWNNDGENDEQTLVGLKIGMITRQKEYVGNDGLEKKRLITYKPISLEDVRAGNYQVPDPIIDNGSQASAPIGNVVDTTAPEGFTENNDDDCPF